MTVIRDTDYKPIQGVPLRSPMAFGGFFIHYLRIRYSEHWGAPWIWREDDTESELYIGSGGSVESELRNNRPNIYVNIGGIRTNPIVVGNNYHTEHLQEKKFSYVRTGMSVTVNCESSIKAESFTLGWHTYTALMAAEDVLRTKYHIANIGPYEMMPPRPGKKDRETYVTSINFSLEFEMSWNVTAVQTKLREIELNLDLKADYDPTRYLTNIYLSSIDQINPE